MDDLQRVFNFTADDLSHNIEGRLSPAQEQAFARSVRRSDMLLGLFIFGWFLFSGPVMILVILNTGSLGILIAVLFWGGMIIALPRIRGTARNYLDWRRSWHAGTVVALDGIRATDFVRLTNRYHVYYSLTVDDVPIMFSEQEYAELEADHIYQFFAWIYREEPQQLLSIRAIAHSE